MRLPVEWITAYAPLDLGPEAIASRLTMAGLEVEATEETDAGVVLDIKVTPNRGDCLSVLGVARELAAAGGTPYLGAPQCPSSEDEPPDAALHTGVTIEDPDLCPRYAARIVENLRLGESPAWMQRRLVAAGMRPISNIVDITNYVMLETGQPLHAFDYETLRERRIVVRRARPDELLVSLDGVTRPLGTEMLVIADAERPVAIAGVMGGADTEITQATRTLLLESAHFDWKSIRRTARILGLGTEASYRFERGVDPDGVVYAADLACRLISETGSGTPVPGVVDEYPRRPAPVRLRLRQSRCSELMGYVPTEDEIAGSLMALGFSVAGETGGVFEVGVPSWRRDVTREVDLVEEVARIVGYERIPERLPSGATTQGGDAPGGALRNSIREFLVGAGLQEVKCHTLVAPSGLDQPEPSLGYGDGARIHIRSALSAELSGLRRSLLPGVCDALRRNARHGLGPLAFFEIGAVFSSTGPATHVEREAVAGAMCGPMSERSWLGATRGAEAFFVGSGVVRALLTSLHADAACEVAGGDWEPDARLHPQRQTRIVSGGRTLGILGELHPAQQAELRLRDRCVVFELDLAALASASHADGGSFVPFSRYPAVTRDLAPRVSRGVPYEAVRGIVRRAAGDILERLALTDVFEGPPLAEGLKSFTVSLTFRSADRTLSEADVEAALTQARDRLRSEVGATFQED